MISEREYEEALNTITEPRYTEALKSIRDYHAQKNTAPVRTANQSEKAANLPDRISGLGLTTRAINCLNALLFFAGIEPRFRNPEDRFKDQLFRKTDGKEVTLKEVMKYISVSELQRIRNCGNNTIEEIRAAFSKCGVEIQ